MTSNYNKSYYFLNLTTLENDPEWLTALNLYCHWFAFTCGFIVCLILTYLTVKKTPKMFKVYSRLIFLSVFIELLFLIINFLSQPVSGNLVRVWGFSLKFFKY